MGQRVTEGRNMAEAQPTRVVHLHLKILQWHICKKCGHQHRWCVIFAERRRRVLSISGGFPMKTRKERSVLGSYKKSVCVIHQFLVIGMKKAFYHDY